MLTNTLTLILIDFLLIENFKLLIAFSNISCFTYMWHPKANNDTLIIAGGYTDSVNGFIILYNLTSKTSRTVTTCYDVRNINILNDGETLLVSMSSKIGVFLLAQYILFTTNIIWVGNISN